MFNRKTNVHSQALKIKKALETSYDQVSESTNFIFV